LYRFEEGDPSQTSADASTPPLANAIRGSNGTVESIDPAWINSFILPIRLTAFGAFAKARGVNLTWTASLDMASVFEVQRSSDGISFATIGTITENTGTNGFKTFTLADTKPLVGKNFYRLKYSEAGGPTLFSKTVSINYSSTGGFIVYPNPVKGNVFTIDLLKPFTGNIEVTLTNSAGAIVFQQKIDVVNSREMRITKLPLLQQGNYVLQISDNNLIRENKWLLVQ
ncbi:MAG: T9SS type A sorting domain-containing protein, partial [Bacteroidota bacterium]